MYASLLVTCVLMSCISGINVWPYSTENEPDEYSPVDHSNNDYVPPPKSQRKTSQTEEMNDKINCDHILNDFDSKIKKDVNDKIDTVLNDFGDQIKSVNEKIDNVKTRMADKIFSCNSAETMIHEMQTRLYRAEQKINYCIFVIVILGFCIIVIVFKINEKIKKKIHYYPDSTSNINESKIQHNQKTDKLELELSLKELKGIPKKNIKAVLHNFAQQIANEICHNYNTKINHQKYAVFQNDNKISQIIYNYLINMRRGSQDITMELPFPNVRITALMRVKMQDRGNSIDLTAYVVSKTIQYISR